MYTNAINHDPAATLFQTGSVIPGRPSMGAWISYALGRINQNLPEFIVLPDPNGLPYNNHGNFTSGFLPAQHQGTVIDASDTQPVRYLFPPKTAKHINTASEAASREVLAKLNARHMARSPGDSRRWSGARRRGCSAP